MIYLITGGCGFIGSNFVKYLLKRYESSEIINLDKLTYAGNQDNFNQEETVNKRHKIIIMDINDPDIKECVKACDVIVHFAAESHVDNSIKSADEFITTNINGTYNLLEIARRYNKRFHHVSTDEVYGSLELGSKEKFNEKTAYAPRNPYSASKAASNHLVMSYYHTHKLPVTISNCSNNYGPYQNIEKFIPKAITNILKGKKVPVYGDGKNVRDWLHVEDHCKAIDKIINDGKIGETYCIGGMGKDYSNLDILEMISKLMGYDMEAVVKYVPDRVGHDRRYAIDWTKIYDELSWEPERSVKVNMVKTIEWYKDNRDWWK